MKAYMKIAAFAAVLLACSCTRIEVEEKTVINEIPQEPLSSYEFDGTGYSVHTLKASYDKENGYYVFLIAREPLAPYRAYINIMIHEDNMGKILDFSDTRLVNRVDYVFMFEDANHYYSPYYAPKGGTMQANKLFGGGYRLLLDMRLADGKPLKFDYMGDF